MSPAISMVKCATDTKTSEVRLWEVLNAIRTGGQRLRDQIEKIRDALRHGDETAKKQAGERKKQLPAVMWSGRFTQRKNEALVQHSGLLCADLDKLGDSLPNVLDKLKASPHLFCLFRSPSGDGLKAVFRVADDAQKHAGSFRAVEQHVRELAGVQTDQACRDVARLCFMSTTRSFTSTGMRLRSHRCRSRRNQKQPSSPMSIFPSANASPWSC